MPKCPYCNSYVLKDAKQCDSCGESLEIQCDYCKEVININAGVCPYCNSRLRTNSVSILVKFNYLLLMLNALIPFWFANSISKHPVFWYKMVEKTDDYANLISSFFTIATISATPAIISTFLNYRKRLCIASVITFVLFCICNIYLVISIR